MNGHTFGAIMENYDVTMLAGQVPAIASPSHQPPSAPSDQRYGVLILCEECDATCSRDLGHEGGYTEPSLA